MEDIKMEENKILRLIYTIFVGVLIAIFIGVGINTFYTPPKNPEYPSELSYVNKEPTAEEKAKQQEFDKQNKVYMEQMKPYNRNVSIITLVAAVVLMGSSLLLQKRIKLIADGVMLGGLFTLFYSLGRGFASENNRYVFIATTIGLAITIYLGYGRFVKIHPSKK